MNNFLSRMKSLLGDEFNDYLKFYNGSSCFRGMRVNTLKCSAEKLESLLDFPLRRTPFCAESFYIPEDVRSPGSSPLHHAGAFYIQEPSAASAVEMLGVCPGDRVLDLCAAPGGKSTQIAAKIGEKGLLWSNEIVGSRANILLSNIERMGIKNSVVSNCRPDELCQRLEGRFDKVLVDAPCSGEGMFRKNSAESQWSEAHVKSCAERQLKILNSAKVALKCGGFMVYSTCTFSREENEGVITRFLERNPDFELADPCVSFGRPTLGYARRIFPMDGGEGHFAAKLRKKEEFCSGHNVLYKNKNEKINSKIFEFYDGIFAGRPFGENIRTVGNKIIVLPENYNFDVRGLHVLRAGIILGEYAKNRIEPHHSAFAAAKMSECRSVVDLSLEDGELYDFLHGEEISVPQDARGFTSVCVEGISLGFGKASNSRLKNKYPKGLRILK